MKSSNDNIKDLLGTSNIKNPPILSSMNSGKNEINNPNGKTLTNAELINMIKGGGSTTSTNTPVSKGAMQDDHGMLGLMNIIRTTHGPNPSLALGIDPDQLGLCSLELSEPIHKNFQGPWCDMDRSGTTILDNYLPSCYNVQPSPSVVTKLSAFADETLFYMFYAMPKDRMQELAAHELTLRQWRYHKDLKVWMIREDIFTSLNQQFGNLRLTSKSPIPFGLSRNQQQTPPPLPHSDSVMSMSSSAASPLRKKNNMEENVPDGLGSSSPGSSKLSFVVFDPQTWSKVKREMMIIPNDDVFENRFNGNETLGNTMLSLSSTT